MTFEEKKRMRQNHINSVKNEYPLIKAKITRKKALKIIGDFNLKVPQKSGCFFCPFQSRKQWHLLFKLHPDLFLKAVTLEERAQSRKPGTYILPEEYPLRKLFNSFKYQQTLDQFL